MASRSQRNGMKKVWLSVTLKVPAEVSVQDVEALVHDAILAEPGSQLPPHWSHGIDRGSIIVRRRRSSTKVKADAG